MDVAILDQYVKRALTEDSVYDKLVSDPASVIDGFSEIEVKVARAIEGMSPTAAAKDLLESPSNDHCIRTSCGIGSFMEP